MAEETAGKKVGLITQGTNYISESVEELKKVQSPTRQETIQATISALAMMFMFALILFIFDLIFSRITASLF